MSGRKKNSVKKVAKSTFIKSPQETIMNDLRGTNLKKISFRAKVTTIEKPSYDIVRNAVLEYLQDILKGVLATVEYSGRATINAESISAALAAKGIQLAAGTTNIKKQQDKDKSTRTTTAKPGKIAAKKIRQAPKSSDRIIIPKAAMRRIIVSIAYDLTGKEHPVSLNARAALQLVTEDYIYQLFKAALLISENEKRKRVLPRDVELAVKLMQKPSNTAYIYSGHNIETYIHNLVKNDNSENGISADAQLEINQLSVSIIGRLTEVTNILLDITGKETPTAKEVSTAIRILFPDNLATPVLKAGKAAVDAHNAYKPKPGERVSHTKIAKLTISTSRVGRIMLHYSTASRKSPSGSIFMAGALEYLLTEIIQGARKIAPAKVVRIKPRHVLIAIRSDADLNTLFPERLYIIGGGVFDEDKKVVEEEADDE